MVKGISSAVQDEDLSGGGFFWFAEKQTNWENKWKIIVQCGKIIMPIVPCNLIVFLGIVKEK